MKTILDFHYFITKDMRVDLTRTQISGTLPILFVFLARTGNAVTAVANVSSPAPGVKITFSGPAGHEQTLYYFKTDLSNGGRSGGFLKWCAGQGPGLSLLKAASYLMHTGEFSNVRNFLLQNSEVLVQDDSGIPLHDLQAAHLDGPLLWDLSGPDRTLRQELSARSGTSLSREQSGPAGIWLRLPLADGKRHAHAGHEEIEVTAQIAFTTLAG